MPIELPVMDPCYFCEIVADRKGWNVLERAELTLTLLNGRQFEVGQCVVIPKRHAGTLLDLSAEEQTAVMAAAKRLADVFVSALDPDGILLYQNNGVGSGQEVPHFHLHVVPRRPGSDWGLGPPHLARLERPDHLDERVATEEKRRTAESLREALGRGA